MTHATPTNDNTPRPDWYDKLLVDYLPFARKFANRMRGNDDADEIVQDFYVDACNRWAAYDPRYKFGTFVYQLVRNAVHNRRAYRRAKMRAGGALSLDMSQDAGMDNWMTTPATQQDHAELSETLRRIGGTREGGVLLRRAMGDELGEIAATMGISRQRVQQLEIRGREKLTGAPSSRARLRKAVG